MNKYKIKKDKYRKARGGYSKILLIICTKCQEELLVYQKDGPGILKRMYDDRILVIKNIKKTETLNCGSCKEMVAKAMIYKKENRPAWKVLRGKLQKKVLLKI